MSENKLIFWVRCVWPLEGGRGKLEREKEGKKRSVSGGRVLIKFERLDCWINRLQGDSISRLIKLLFPSFLSEFTLCRDFQTVKEFNELLKFNFFQGFSTFFFIILAGFCYFPLRHHFATHNSRKASRRGLKLV